MRVSNAGGRGSQVNGRYVPTDTYNGKPKFRQQNGSGIIYFDCFWKINYRDDPRGWYYSDPHQCAMVPPTGEWTIAGYSGGDANPAPEVVRAFEAGDSVKFVNLTLDDIEWSSCPRPKLSPVLGQSYTVNEIRGEWFQDRSSSHWGPLSAVEVVQDTVTDDSEDWTPAGYDEEWISIEESWAQVVSASFCFCFFLFSRTSWTSIIVNHVAATMRKARSTVE